MDAQTTDTANPSLWHQRVQSLTFRNQAFINGRFQPAASGQTFACHSPIDGRLLTHVEACDAADVDLAVAAARRAFDSGMWSRMALAQRKAILQRFAALVAEHADELALLETLDMGKPITAARHGDLAAVISGLNWYAEAVDKHYDQQAPVGPDAVGLITLEPIGVVGAVVPWNYPLMMATWKFAPALAAGNCVIVKPAEQSPLSMLRVAELASAAGVPDGVLQVLPGFGETAGQALGRHGGVDMLTFTGSTTVGKLFLRYSADSNMKQVSLECGGKSPNIVCADADITAAAAGAAAMIFSNAGQVCVAGSRLLLDRRIKDEFMRAFLQAATSWQPGDPLDPATRMGAIVDTVQCQRILDYIALGQSEGARLLLGGQRVRTETGGTYIAPTVFDDVSNAMTIAREEIFGPVLSVLTYDTLDEAITIANDSSYGLQAYVWTRDLGTAHRVARDLQAGTVLINHAGSAGLSMPFGGYKQSGLGRDKGLQAMQKYCEVKSTYINIA